jgi:hypothetical protein
MIYWSRVKRTFSFIVFSRKFLRKFVFAFRGKAYVNNENFREIEHVIFAKTDTGNKML